MVQAISGLTEYLAEPELDSLAAREHPLTILKW
jgi:hypothetical protein